MSVTTAECGGKSQATGNTSRIWWVQSASDGLQHAVSEPAFLAGMEQGTGEYRSVRDEVLTAAALTEPPGGRCPACAIALRGMCREPQHPAGSHRRPRAAWRWRLAFGRARRTNKLAPTCARSSYQRGEHLEVQGLDQ